MDAVFPVCPYREGKIQIFNMETMELTNADQLFQSTMSYNYIPGFHFSQENQNVPTSMSSQWILICTSLLIEEV